MEIAFWRGCLLNQKSGSKARAKSGERITFFISRSCQTAPHTGLHVAVKELPTCLKPPLEGDISSSARDPR